MEKPAPLCSLTTVKRERKERGRGARQFVCTPRRAPAPAYPPSDIIHKYIPQQEQASLSIPTALLGGRAAAILNSHKKCSRRAFHDSTSLKRHWIDWAVVLPYLTGVDGGGGGGSGGAARLVVEGRKESSLTDRPNLKRTNDSVHRRRRRPFLHRSGRALSLPRAPRSDRSAVAIIDQERRKEGRRERSGGDH